MRALFPILLLSLEACDGADKLLDEDGDGYFATEDDCDDQRADVHPGATEVCDHADNDCNGEVDDDPLGATEWFPDADGDSFGIRGDSVIACAAPPGYAANQKDCNDHDDTVFPGAPELCNGRDDDCDTLEDEGLEEETRWYADNDGDGWGAGNPVGTGCLAEDGWSRYDTDCDDTDWTIHPEADEICNSRDDDCDGSVDVGALDPFTWYRDADADGYGNPLIPLESCGMPSGYVASPEDCDDTDPAINPETLWFEDRDHDGYGDPDVPWGPAQCWQPIGYVADAGDCAPTDPDLNAGTLWHADADADGWGADLPSYGCPPDDGSLWRWDAGDCDDTLEAVNPDATERCNGYDDDCDTLVDDDDDAPEGTTAWYLDWDEDGYGTPSPAIHACAAPPAFAATTDDCDDRDPSAHPGAAWFLDLDGDGCGDPAAPLDEEVCERPDGFVGNAMDPDDADALVTAQVSWYEDLDGDGLGGAWVGDGCIDRFDVVDNHDDCDDTNPGAGEGLPDVSFPATFAFTYCWSSCSPSTWTLYEDGTWGGGGYTGKWTYDCAAKTIVVTYDSGTAYTGITTDGHFFQGTMVSFLGATGTWYGTL